MIVKRHFYPIYNKISGEVVLGEDEIKHTSQTFGTCTSIDFIVTYMYHSCCVLDYLVLIS